MQSLDFVGHSILKYRLRLPLPMVFRRTGLLARAWKRQIVITSLLTKLCIYRTVWFIQAAIFRAL